MRKRFALPSTSALPLKLWGEAIQISFFSHVKEDDICTEQQMPATHKASIGTTFASVKRQIPTTLKECRPTSTPVMNLILHQIVYLRLFHLRLEHATMPVSLYEAKYDALRALLRAARVDAKLTQIEMAAALGVGQSYVSKIERGENFVDVLLFARWCEACGLNAGKVLDKFLAASPVRLGS